MARRLGGGSASPGVGVGMGMGMGMGMGSQLAVGRAVPADRPDPDECAATAPTALALPDVASLRPKLVSVFPIHAPGGEGELVTGRADAIAVEGGRITAVVDWKSDLAPTDAARRARAGQMAEYLVATGAVRGAIVYVTRSEVTWVERDGHLVG